MNLYRYVSMPINEVMAEPEKFIIPENRAAIDYLWNMNILTTQTNNYENNESWIAIGMLSRENQKIFDKMRNDHEAVLDHTRPGILADYGGGLRVPVVPGTKDTLEDFLPLFHLFKFQDVQRDGYMTLDEFFGRYTDCYKMIENPYLKMCPEPSDFETTEDFLEASFNYFNQRYPNTPRIRVFDPDKATKSIEEYIEEAGFGDCYDAEEGKVFYNRRLYEGHMRYKEMNKEEGMKL